MGAKSHGVKNTPASPKRTKRIELNQVGITVKIMNNTAYRIIIAPNAITGANQNPTTYHTNHANKGNINMIIRVVVDSFCLCFHTIPNNATILNPSTTEPLIVLSKSVPIIARKSDTPPAIKKTLRDFVHFIRLATQLVTAVRPTMTRSTLLNS